MRQTRKRFTIPSDLLGEAEEYARQDNRTFSEFVCETIRQHMKRYPKSRHATDKSIDARLSELENIVRQLYPHVH